MKSDLTRVILQERVKFFFVKSFFFFLNYFTITCKRLIKAFVYKKVANLILYNNKH